MDEQKKQPRNVVAKIFLILLAIIMIVYLIYNTVRLIMRPTDTFVVEQGILDLSESVDAYVIRDEDVLQGNNYMNGMEKIITEGN